MNKFILKKEHKIILGIICSLIGLGLVLLDYFLGKEWTPFLVYFINILGSIILFIGMAFLYLAFKKGERKLTVRQMTLVGIMSSLSVILYYFVKFNLPFFPPWLDIQVSEIPALITGFAYGPYAGVLVIFIRFIVKLPATITAGVGEVADLILSAALVYVSSLSYKRNRTIKGALKGTIIGVVTCTVLSIFVNWFILIPAYVNIAGFPLNALAGMLSNTLGMNVTSENFMFYYLIIGVLPFNLFRYCLVAVFTFLLYKRTHLILKRLAKR
jgi:riboflavin transporter FmnP